MDIIATNNPLAEAEFRDRFKVEFFEDAGGVLAFARDLVHAGHSLMTHPLAGSVKPNETPYKTILISGSAGGSGAAGGAGVVGGSGAAGGAGGVDAASLRMIEECIRLTRGFPPLGAPVRHMADLQMVDLMLIRSALDGR